MSAWVVDMGAAGLHREVIATTRTRDHIRRTEHPPRDLITTIGRRTMSAPPAAGGGTLVEEIGMYLVFACQWNATWKSRGHCPTIMSVVLNYDDWTRWLNYFVTLLSSMTQEGRNATKKTTRAAWQLHTPLQQPSLPQWWCQHANQPNNSEIRKRWQAGEN